MSPPTNHTAMKVYTMNTRDKASPFMQTKMDSFCFLSPITFSHEKMKTYMQRNVDVDMNKKNHL